MAEKVSAPAKKKGAKVYDAPEKKKKGKKSKPKPDQYKENMPPWKVLLHNDDKNDIAYVVRTIVELTKLKTEEAVTCTNEAHKTGVGLILVTNKERAELYVDQFESKSLTVTIEAAEK
jgi:ATP-dependent Clp protease adaptor protein ClpS